MRTHPRISVAASAIVRHVANGGWIGASYPLYIKACRHLRGNEYRAALRRANMRWFISTRGWETLDGAMQGNFAIASHKPKEH